MRYRLYVDRQPLFRQLDETHTDCASILARQLPTCWLRAQFAHGDRSLQAGRRQTVVPQRAAVFAEALAFGEFVLGD